MIYNEACSFLECEYKEYTPDEIKKIYKQGMLKYHPDKRVTDNPSIVQQEFFKFTEAIEVLKGGIVLSHYQPVEEFVSTIAEIYIISAGIYQNAKNKKIKIKTIEQIIKHSVSTFDLFAKKQYKIVCPIAYEGKGKYVKLEGTFTPELLENKFESMGHKNFGEYAGDIIVKCIHYNDPDEMFTYNQDTNELLICKEYKAIYDGKEHQVLLPCNNVIVTFAKICKKANDTKYYCGHHPIYNKVKVYLVWAT